MAWETRRNGNRYYYRKKRHGSRVVSKYVGTGALGEVACLMDAEERLKRSQERFQLQEELRDSEEEARVAKVLILELMAQIGYHWQRGEWRLKRA